jgi:acetyl-CoA carboxylase carboxyltransferase component
VTTLTSRLDAVSDDRRTAMLEQLDLVHAETDKALGGGGEKYVQRHLSRGKLLPRQRIELLLDRDTPFLELMPVAA